MTDRTPFDDLVKQFQTEQAAAAFLGFAGSMADYFHALLESKLTRAEALALTLALQTSFWSAANFHRPEAKNEDC